MRYLIAIILLMHSLLFNAKEKRALLIGISEYPQHQIDKEASWNSIHGANDALLLSKTLKAQNFKVRTILNKEATASNIRKAIKKLASEATKGDLIYIHISSHGQPFEDKNGDENDGWDESIVPYDAYKKPIPGIYQGDKHIIDDEMELSLASIRKSVGPSGFIYVIIDACHAGEFQRNDDEEEYIYIRGTRSGFSLTNKSYTPQINRSSTFKIPSNASMSDICMIEACRSYQTNCEIKEDGVYYGPLSFYINRIIRKHDLTSDLSWLTELDGQMKSDRRLSKQNIVIEKSQK